MTKSTRNMRYMQVAKEELSDVLVRPTVLGHNAIEEKIAYFESMMALDADGVWKKWYPRTTRITHARKLEAHFCVENPKQIDARSKKERRLVFCETCIDFEAGL